jgi:hypothetical protein
VNETHAILIEAPRGLHAARPNPTRHAWDTISAATIEALARRLYDESRLLADSSGNAELQAHVLANMAMQSTYMARVKDYKGLARESLRLGDQASDTARHEPSHRLHALIALRQAAAHAELGDAAAFRKAINSARNELDRGSHPADVPWTAFVTPSEVTGHEAMGYARLGHPARAVALYQSVLADAGLAPRNRVCYEALHVRALLEAGDSREAISGGLKIVPVLNAGRMTTARPLTQLGPIQLAAEKPVRGSSASGSTPPPGRRLTEHERKGRACGRSDVPALRRRRRTSRTGHRRGGPPRRLRPTDRLW